MRKMSSVFDIYESVQLNPEIFRWTDCSELITVDPEEYIHSGYLTTIDDFDDRKETRFYVLTTDKLIESSDISFNCKLNSTSILPLKNPKLIESVNSDTDL